MANRITLSLETRTIMGKQVKKLRKDGIVPVHLYGPSISPRFLQCSTPNLLRVLVQAGSNTPVFVTLPDSGEEHLAFVREVQWDPLRGTLLHADLLQTEISQRISAEVPILLEGESQAAREAGGTVGQVLRTLSVEALPLDMPGDLRVDVSVLTDDSNVLRAGDIGLPGNVTLLTDPEEMVARIELPVRAGETEEVEGAGPEATEEEAE
ncbi:MAG: 50S ribosomal protein L25 [Dehalococcoidia bacterium]|nr:50S ribosomal protein L25 [Dehalococcoidia bacterium]